MMSSFSLPMTRLIHENLSIVMTFAYSVGPLAKMTQDRFAGEWKYLDKALFEISAERAEKACLELALFLRIVDEDEEILAYQKATKNVHDCGKLIMKDGSEKPLSFRDVANKILHSSRLEWKPPNGSDAFLICHTRDKEKWVRAEVNLVALSAVCAMLAS